MSIKLPKLPDRTPVKVTLSLNPELHQSIQEYAEIYRETYGQSECEPVAEILPYMIQDYLDKHKAFAKTRKRKTKPEAVQEPKPGTSLRRTA